MEESIWIKIIKATGSVGVVSFLLYFLVDKLFKQEIYALLGGEKLFIIILIILSILAVALVSAIYVGKPKASSNSGSNGNTVMYKDSSIHQGDNKF